MLAIYWDKQPNILLFDIYMVVVLYMFSYTHELYNHLIAGNADNKG